MRNTWKKAAAFAMALALVAGVAPANVDTGGFFGGTTIIAHATDEVSENISLVASVSSNLSTISGTHYSVSCGYMVADDKGMRVNSFGALTINARKGETISKVILSYSEGGYRNTLSASIGTFDGNSTITGINAQQVSISSTSKTGVIISAVTVYFEGSLSNPTVTLTGGANAKSSGGLLTQSYLPGAMDTVTYTALTGATFPEFETYMLNGVTVERTSDTVVTISGTPTANTAIIVPDAVSSSKIVTWNSATISSITGCTIPKDYTYTANDITIYKTGKGKIDTTGIYGYDSTASFKFTTATGKFTNIEIASSSITCGGNWTTDGNTLKWNGTPSNSVSLSGKVYLEGVSSINFVIEMPADLSTATVTLGADNTVSSITVGGNEITDLSEFDITYGTDESHTATEPPTEDGTYYAYVTAKTESENYTGTAKSEAFEVAAAPTISSASVTLGDDLALNFYVDGIADETAAAEYSVKFEGECVDKTSALAYNAAVGKYYATTHVYAKDIDKDITATLCNGSDTVATLENYSISKYLTAAESGADEKTSALINATKDFGNASSEYFYGTGSGYSDGFASYAPDTSAYAATFDSDAAKLSLVLDSKTAARLYVKDDTTGAESTINATKADYPTYHEITGLLPQNLADEQTITVGETEYKFSALTWCYRVLNNTNASQKNINMAKAIMAYYTAAANYTDNTIQLAVGDLNFTYTEGQTWNDITLPDGVGIDSENHIIYNNRILSYNSSGAWVTADTEIGSPAGYYWETIDVASVAITNAPTEAIKVGNTGTLNATVSPDNATNKTVTWAVTEGTDVLSINAATGAYTALKAGTAKVTATAGGKSATCVVTVEAAGPATVVAYSFDDANSPSLTPGSRVSFDYSRTSVITNTAFLNAYNNANGDPGASTLSLGDIDLSDKTWTLTFEWAACGGCNSKLDHTTLKSGAITLFDIGGNSNWNTTVTISYDGSDGTKKLLVPGCDKSKRFKADTGDLYNTTTYWHHIVVTGSASGVKMTITNSETGTVVVEDILLSSTNVNPTSLIIEPCCGGAIGIDELLLTYTE